VSETRSFVCVACPIGCPLVLTHEGREVIEIQGNACDRGAKYARQEFTDPRRALSTTVAIGGARWPRLPVKVTRPIPKDRVREASRLLHALRVEAPVERGRVLVRDFLGEPGNEVVACRGMERVADPVREERPP
jgi:CxxC motif-containing protein